VKRDDFPEINLWSNKNILFVYQFLLKFSFPFIPLSFASFNESPARPRIPAIRPFFLIK